MVDYLVIMGLLLAAGYWIIRPLLDPHPYNDSSTGTADESIRELQIRKDNAYAAIRELEFDLNMGKLSNDDFETLKEQYTVEALDCLKAIDQLQQQEKRAGDYKQEPPEGQVKEEIFARRAGKKKKAVIYCVQCGAGSSHQDRFCHACGTQLSKAEIKQAAI